jgi:geranylgeranyl diphosphate synthase type II
MLKAKELLNQYTKETENVILSYLPSEEGYQKTVLSAMNYSVKAGGKRLRPLLLMEMYRMFGGKGREAEPFMAAIEMIHTFSLVHDDLPCMDNDEFRRGLPTTWVKYGYEMAVLAGDGLYGYAFETAAKALEFTQNPARIARCMGILAQKSGIYGMIGGQTLDVELTKKPVNKEQLEFIYRLKTGALIECPMVIGAVLAGADEDQVSTVERMASCIGKAFQIQDDILDVTSSQEVLGKPVLSDEKNGKNTYVALYGMEQAKQAVKELSEEAVLALESLPGDHEFMRQLIMMLVTREK